MNNLKLPLQIKRKQLHDTHMPWATCLPFVDNRIAQLIHRPRTVSTYKTGNRPAHLGIHAWCGNSFCGTDKFTFLSELPENGKLLCARCEKIAVENGMPSAESLTGRHVHLGKLKPIRICCLKEQD